MTTRHAILAGLGVLFLAPGFARADGPSAPALPPGFEAPATTTEVPRAPRPTGGMQSIFEETFLPRSLLRGERHDVEALPVVETEPEDEPTPTSLPPSVSTDVTVLRGKRVSISGFEAGMLEVEGANPVATGRQSDGGATPCTHDTWPPVKRFDYSALRRTDDKGNFELAWGSGFIAPASCRLAVAHRFTVRPAVIVASLVYGFRTHCAACKEGMRDEVHLVTPQILAGFGPSALDVVTPFSHLRLVAGSGQSSAVEGGMVDSPNFGPSPWSMPVWTDLFGHGETADGSPRPADAAGFACGSRLHVEVARGLEEQSPTMWVGCN
jgi:hypothetical protein